MDCVNEGPPPGREPLQDDLRFLRSLLLDLEACSHLRLLIICYTDWAVVCKAWNRNNTFSTSGIPTNLGICWKLRAAETSKSCKADGKQQHNQLLKVGFLQSAVKILLILRISWAGKLDSGLGTCWQTLIWVYFWICCCCNCSRVILQTTSFSDLGFMFSLRSLSLAFRRKIQVKLWWTGYKISSGFQATLWFTLVWGCELL